MATETKIKYQTLFNGYKTYRDITKQTAGSIVSGSKNVFIRDASKIEVRGGMKFFGAEGTQPTQSDPYWTVAHRIHSKYDYYQNIQGVVIPIRIWYTGVSAQGDVVEALLPVDGVATNENKAWIRIIDVNSNAVLKSKHRVYFAEWYNNTTKQNQIVFTSGNISINYWTGGFANITVVTPTTLKTDAIWERKGFHDVPEGTNKIIVNGVSYTVTSGWNTDTLTLSSTAGITVGDVAVQSIGFADSLSGQTTYDVCSMLNNRVYYVDFKQSVPLLSWNRNKPSEAYINATNAFLNDMVISGTYIGATGNDYNVLKYEIDGVPQPPIKSFSASVAGNQDNIIFSGTHTGTSRDVYTVLLNSVGASYLYNIYLNGVLLVANNALLSTPYVAPNGITISFAGLFFPTPNNVGDTWRYEVGGQDTYRWYANGVLQAPQNNPITTPLVYNGVTMKPSNTSGHTIGDYWEIQFNPLVEKGFSVFHHSLSGTVPGEGVDGLKLDSNGFTMQPQEEFMYINTQAGQWYTISSKLSSNLLSETFEVKRLKSEPRNRTLFPYLLGYTKNQLSIISVDKTFDLLGRQKFVELPQTNSISDVIRPDFVNADWTNGDIVYGKRMMFFCLPEEGKILVYDDYNKYWHAPMEHGRKIGLISIIDNKIIGHSYERNESYELFTEEDCDLGIYSINTHIVFPYDSFNERLTEKYLTAFGADGYLEKATDTKIKFRVNFGLNACDGFYENTLKPFFCVNSDKASLGKGNLGQHGLGNDPVNTLPFFSYIKPIGNRTFYFRNVELSCDSLHQKWSVTAVGTDIYRNAPSNVSITDNTTI